MSAAVAGGPLSMTWMFLAAACAASPLASARSHHQARTPAAHRGRRSEGAGGRKGLRRGRGARGIAACAAALACLVGVGGLVGLWIAACTGPVVALVVTALQRESGPVDPDPDLPLVLDLAAAALRGGQPLAQALALAAPASSGPSGEALRRVASLLRLGSEPAQAWAQLPRDGPLGELSRVAVRSASSGVRMAVSFEVLAADLRVERTSAATQRAHRVGVHGLAPLTACFLPAFVCLGIVPVVVDVVGTAVRGLP